MGDTTGDPLAADIELICANATSGVQGWLTQRQRPTREWRRKTYSNLFASNGGLILTTKGRWVARDETKGTASKFAFFWRALPLVLWERIRL